MERQGLGALLAGNPLWRPVWGLYLDRRFFRSPALHFVLLIVLVLVSEAKLTETLGQWQAGTAPARTQDRWYYAAVIWWVRHGLDLALLLFALAVLWRAVRSTPLAASLVTTPLTARHLWAVALFPIAAVWALAQASQWIQATLVAGRLAEPGESLLWLMRRPGRITILSDAVISPAVVMSHNALVGSIALMGYAVFVLGWSWCLVGLVSRARSLGRAYLGLAVVCGVVAGLSWLVAHIQSVISLVNPLAIWTFPPGTATYSSWRMSLVGPLHHFLMYLTMHLGVLIVEMGLVGYFGGRLERALDSLWESLATPPLSS